MKNRSLFHFVVKYLGFLKIIPLLPHVFDSMLKLWCLITRSYLLDWLDEIETEVLSWEGVSTSSHKYGGLQFNYKGKEIGHLHSNGLLDILYSREVKKSLLEKGRIEPHHLFEKSGWISFYIVNFHDRTYAKELLEIAYNSSLKRCNNALY